MHKDDLSNALEENAEEETPPLTHLLEAFGPGTFATLEEMARYFFFSILFYFKRFYIYIYFFSDEENDAKLWTDIVESIKDWQQSKVIKIQQRNRGLHRSVLFFKFTNLLKLNFP